MTVRNSLSVAPASVSVVIGSLVLAQQTPPLTPDIPAKFDAPISAYDYVKRDVMIPMRDGVKLHTVIVVPKGARNAPILLTRTPYNASARAERNASPHMVAALPLFDELFAADGYIRVYQDVRGKYGSEGEYVMTRPLRGPLNKSNVDHSTDAFDTISGCEKTPESNGRVGMVGSSYEGFTVVMALVNPHPALKAAVPESPMIDGWMGDDWFHYGAFRQVNLDYFADQTSVKGAGKDVVREGYDDYENFRRAGSAGDWAKAAGFDQLPWWHKVTEHPSYDAFWQAQALYKTMAAQPLTVRTIWLQGLWDQEDMWGAIHSYQAVEPKDTGNDKNFLVMGPWFHSQINREGTSLGPLRWNGDTTLEVRRDIIKPFFDQYLKDGAPKAEHAARTDLQHCQQPLGPVHLVAAGM
jgi:putative CocE/NonD family hydrolase